MGKLEHFIWHRGVDHGKSSPASDSLIRNNSKSDLLCRALA